MIYSEPKGESPKIDEKVSASNTDRSPGSLFDKLESTDNSITIEYDPATKKVDLKGSGVGGKNYAYLVDVSPGGGE